MGTAIFMTATYSPGAPAERAQMERPLDPHGAMARERAEHEAWERLKKKHHLTGESRGKLKPIIANLAAGKGLSSEDVDLIQAEALKTNFPSLSHALGQAARKR